MLRASSWRCAREGRVKPEVRVVAKSRRIGQTAANSGAFQDRVLPIWGKLAPGPPLGAQNWPTVRGKLKNQSRKISLSTDGIGALFGRPELAYGWGQIENKITLRPDGPHEASGLAPTSILTLRGKFRLWAPPRPLEPRPEPSRNRPKLPETKIDGF